MKKIKIISITAVIIATLVGCGGGSNETQSINTAPIAAADKGTAQNNLPITLDVLANDSDKEANTLTITKIVTNPSSGTVEISNNQLVYTPAQDVALIDTFTYEISDGELTATADVEVTVNHTLIISGIVTDSPIANAQVTAKLGGETFVTTADDVGSYTLNLTINTMTPELLVISAVGHPDKNQSNIELIAVIDDTTSLLTAVSDNRNLVVDDNSTNVTHVTTAAYLLTLDRNENIAISSIERYKTLVSELDIDKMISTAGFIKLLVDNDEFSIPDGETTLSLLAKHDNLVANTADAIHNYLVVNTLLDENSEPTQAYQNALASAIKSTISDPNVVEQFTKEMFDNKTMINLPAVKEGWLPYRGNSMVFADNNTTFIYEIGDYSEPKAIAYERSIVDGKLRLKTDEFTPTYIGQHYYPYNTLVDEYGFDQSVADELKLAYESGKITDNIVLNATEHIDYIDYTLIDSNAVNYQVATESNRFYQLTMPETFVWINPTPKSKAFTIEGIGTLVHSANKLWLDKTLTDLAGDWVLYLDGQFIDNFNNLAETNSPIAKVAQLNPASESAIVEGKEYSAALVDGILSLKSGVETYRYQPIKASANAYFTIIEKWFDGQLEYSYAKQIAKFDNSYEGFINNLATELPKAQFSYINGSSPDVWKNDKLKLDNIFGYQFSLSGSLRRGIGGVLADEEFNQYQLAHFSLGDQDWTWNYEANKVNIDIETSYSKRHRTWQVISVDEQGYALVLEQSTYGSDSDQNGVIDADEIGQFIRPRLNIIKQVDLSDWPEAWQNTQDLGLATLTSVIKVQSKITKVDQKLLN